MSGYENGRNIFLLQTENLEPLIEAIGILDDKIAENQSTIQRLTQRIDDDFEFPQLAIKGYIEADGAHQKCANRQLRGGEEVDKVEHVAGDCESANDTLRKFLNIKYQLDKIPLKSLPAHRNARVQSLLDDIQRLKVLRTVGSARNRQLYEVIEDYEKFVLQDVLPRLRKDIEKHRELSFKDIKDLQVDTKFDCELRIWDTYLQYVEYLNKLIRACEMLAHEVEYMGDEEVLKMEQKLIILHQVKLHLTKGA